MSIATRCIRTSFYPITSALPLTSEKDKFSYLGIVKNTPHYVNQYNEVYFRSHCGDMEYAAEWLEDYKMLWTDHPIIYRLRTQKAINFFYDVDYKDAYYFNPITNLIQPIGFYDRKTDTFRMNSYNEKN